MDPRRPRLRRASIVPVLACALTCGGLSGRSRAELVEVRAAATPRCDDLDLDSLASALGRLHGLLLRPRMGALRIGRRLVPPADYAKHTVLPLLEVAGDRDRLCAKLTQLGWWRDATLPAGKVLFSAYYTPTVPGSLERDERFRFPLYRRPADATRHDTAQILAGSLTGRGLELVWLEDAYDALALQVEGGAQIRLPDGRVFAIGTDGHNGKPYENVSKLLIADGRLNGIVGATADKPGNPKARAYFAAHPDALARYWGRNPHFVYFKQVAQAGGGKLGMLTNGRSLAVDPSVYPLGTILFVRPQHGFADGDGTPARVAVAMDTGAAIKGPARLDVYFGDDEAIAAKVAAGSVEGEAYVLLAR